MIALPRVAREALLPAPICALLDSLLPLGVFEQENLVETWNCMKDLPMPSIDRLDALNHPSNLDLAYAACFAMGSATYPASTLLKVGPDSEGFRALSPDRHESFAMALNLSDSKNAMLCVDREPLRTAFEVKPRQFAFVPDARLLSGVVNDGPVLLFYYPKLAAPLPERSTIPEFHGLLCPPTASVAAPPYPDKRHYFAISLYAKKGTLARLLPSRSTRESTALFDWLGQNTRPCPDRIPGFEEVEWHWVPGTDTFVGLPIVTEIRDPVLLSMVCVVSSHYRTAGEALSFLQTVIPGAKEAHSTVFAKPVTLEEGLDDLFD